MAMIRMFATLYFFANWLLFFSPQCLREESEDIFFYTTKPSYEP